LKYICPNLKASRFNLGPIYPNNPTLSLLMTSAMIKFSLLKSTPRVRKVPSKLKLTLVLIKVFSLFLIKSNSGSPSMETVHSTLRSNPITISRCTMTTE